jgi:hypothetical protein
MANPIVLAIRTSLRQNAATKDQKFSVRYTEGRIDILWNGVTTPSVAARALMPANLIASNVVFVHNNRNYHCSVIRRWYTDAC